MGIDPSDGTRQLAQTSGIAYMQLRSQLPQFECELAPGDGQPRERTFHGQLSLVEREPARARFGKQPVQVTVDRIEWRGATGESRELRVRAIAPRLPHQHRARQ